MGQNLGKCCECNQNEQMTEKFPNANYISNNVEGSGDNSFTKDDALQSMKKRTPIIKKYPIHQFNEKILATVSKSGDSTLSNIESIRYDQSKIITIQSFYKAYHSRIHFLNVTKQTLIEHKMQMYNDLCEQSIKYNTKLAESLIGYKFTLRQKSFSRDQRDTEMIFHNVLVNYPNSLISSFYYGDVNIDNKKHGFGVHIFSDGSKYEGNWIKDQFTGFGRYINSNGDLYEGEFKEGKLNSNGLKRGIDGSIYLGEFENGIKKGKGCEENEEIEYKGEFDNDYRQGKGKIVFKKIKESYEGEFYKGVINGIGIYNFKSGDVYQGEFKNGKMHGKGLYKWKSGEEYYGDYVEGIKEGNGVFKYINGKVFDGQFKKGKPWGCGKIRIEHKNKEYNVVFQNGKIVESSYK